MEKYRIVLLFVFVILYGIFVSCSSNSNNTVELTYSASDAKFPNPERGFYKASQTNLGDAPTLLIEDSLKAYRSRNITLLYRYFYLKSFRDKALTQEVLDQINADLALMRKTGMKNVMRFAYSSRETEADAPLDVVLLHLDQLKPVFEKNADVIAVLQAGFIGAWGEWYYSSNNLKTPETRAAILDKMLQVLPEKRMIQIRTPGYKTEYLRNSTPLTPNEAFSGSKAARIGHHNDCFLASINDYGTYEDIELEKNYINAEGVFLPVGGETCPPNGVDPADCQKAENEMRTLRWTFLNEDYYRGVNNRWKELGCMDNIIRELGYRFVLHSATYSGKIAPGGSLDVRMKLNNVGYASLFNPRKVEFVLKNIETSQLYIAATNEDPRFWQPRTNTELKLSLGIPKDMPKGTYQLYLHLPDPEPLLYGNPDYSIRLANEDVWEPKTGYNNLHHRVRVGGSLSSAYSGDIWFKMK